MTWWKSKPLFRMSSMIMIIDEVMMMDRLELLRMQPYDERIALTVMLFYTIKSTNASLQITFNNVRFASMLMNVDASEVWRIVVNDREKEVIDRAQLPDEFIKMISIATLMVFPMEVNDENR